MNITSFPLSSNQKGLYLHQQLSPSDNAYHIPTILHFDKHLDSIQLSYVINELATRHETLKARIKLDANNNPVNALEETVFKVTEMREAGDAIQPAMKTLLDIPFDLTNAPLVRFYLFHPSSASSILYIVHHHIILDYFPHSFVKELEELYEKFS